MTHAWVTVTTMFPALAREVKRTLECSLVTPAESTDRADPITRLIASRLPELRRSRGLTQAQLGTAMGKLRPGWTRSTVAKLENLKRQDLSIADWMALAVALSIPPPLLIADPRFPDERVPITTDYDDTPWDALFWMMGREHVAPLGVEVPDFELFGRGFEVMHCGWEIMEATVELNRRDHRWPDSDEEDLRKVEANEQARHRASLFRLQKALNNLRSRGVRPPPLQSFVLKRAQELGFDQLLTEYGG